jgi:hypothetical protein
MEWGYKRNCDLGSPLKLQTLALGHPCPTEPAQHTDSIHYSEGIISLTSDELFGEQIQYPPAPAPPLCHPHHPSLQPQFAFAIANPCHIEPQQQQQQPPERQPHCLENYQDHLYLVLDKPPTVVCTHCGSFHTNLNGFTSPLQSESIAYKPTTLSCPTTQDQTMISPERIDLPQLATHAVEPYFGTASDFGERLGIGTHQMQQGVQWVHHHHYHHHFNLASSGPGAPIIVSSCLSRDEYA